MKTRSKREMRLQGNDTQKPGNGYSFDLNFSPLIHMTPFLFQCSFTGWSLGGQALTVVLMSLWRSPIIQMSYPRGLEVARSKYGLSVEIFNQDDLGYR